MTAKVCPGSYESWLGLPLNELVPCPACGRELITQAHHTVDHTGRAQYTPSIPRHNLYDLSSPDICAVCGKLISKRRLRYSSQTCSPKCQRPLTVSNMKAKRRAVYTLAHKPEDIVTNIVIDPELNEPKS